MQSHVKVVGQCSIPFDVAKHLSITEELGKVDVEYVSGMFDHDVVIMTITDTKHVRSDTVASTTSCEVIHSQHTAE